MDRFIINGVSTLRGEISVSGSKNAILPIMATSLLLPGKATLGNVPHLIDLKTMSHLLRVLGARVESENHTMTIDSRDICYYEAPYELVNKMRASIYVLGPLLARLGEARVSFPGGCAIGTRPVDLHLKAMQKLGAEISLEHGYIHAKAKKLKGAVINFDKSSVGATINTLMASVLAEGTTEIYNAAIEPEVDSTVDFLILAGADVKGKGTAHLTVTGVKELHSAEMEMIPDRIEAGTFMIAGALGKEPVTVSNCHPPHLSNLIEKLSAAGCELQNTETSVTVIPPKRINPINITTAPYPGFPTDLQAQFMVLMSLADGVCFIEDTIFPDRFMHVAELNRLQADIRLTHNIAAVHGVKELSGAEIMATDLRASAALVLAGVFAQGETVISRIYHIDRGYDRIEEKLNAIGAKISRELV